MNTKKRILFQSKLLLLPSFLKIWECRGVLSNVTLTDFIYLCPRYLYTTKHLCAIVLYAKAYRILRELEIQKEPRYEV